MRLKKLRDTMHLLSCNIAGCCLCASKTNLTFLLHFQELAAEIEQLEKHRLDLEAELKKV